MMNGTKPSQNHTKDVTWKIESASTQCSAATSPVSTPPLMHGPSPQKAQSKKAQIKYVINFLYMHNSNVHLK